MAFSRRNSDLYGDFAVAAGGQAQSASVPIKVGGFEWQEGQNAGNKFQPCHVEELRARPETAVRIIFAPLDLPTPKNVGTVLKIFKLYSIPAAFVSERLHNVTHSFGSMEEEDGCTYSWFHFLCKNVPVADETGQKVIKNINIDETKARKKQLSQADFSWIRSGYCLKVIPSDIGKGWSEATLLVFGGDLNLWQRLDSMSTATSAQAILEDPFCLFAVVFDTLYDRIDEIAWNLAAVYSQEEEKILISADYPGRAADALDFVGLHMLSKQQIYLLEATGAITATLDSLQDYHDRVSADVPASFAVCQTQAALRHNRTGLKSTDLRLRSLEKRTQNIINLSFNLVTQADSRIMKADSSSMKTVAVMTLLFLPATAVASIFATPFFSWGIESEAVFVVSAQIWWFWGSAVPLTLIVMFIWYMFQRKLKRQIILGEQPRLPKDIV